ncbi:MAG: alanine:cation symporter family protein [Phycisphaerales bacterium]|nr:alanine:cation symporter family protein [Phycisphaerales bacterium]MCB9836806.1 alanine:cation symporter family protein [Phycisphaera sp.]
MDSLWGFLDTLNGIIWHNYVLYVVLGVGVLFTIWSGLGQFRALTHGVSVVRGKYDDKNDPGAINHFQALSAALSATVGLGNIAGVGTAVALGGPGAVFWMWMVGLFGMALKMTEVTQSMLYRNTDDPENPHGGPMFVVKKGMEKMGLGALGSAIGGIFVVTLLISTITGGNMFQAWSVGEITENYFQVPSVVTGIILALLVGMVILGGIKRIGAVAGRIVPLMCGMYFIAAVVVILMNIGQIPDLLKLIVVEAFSPSKAEGAFLGGTAGYALLWGMKRALFSSESGQGSSPIAHSAAKTDEPVREGVVAGLEPFIDTIVVCTLTALVILSSGAWNRGPEANFVQPLRAVALDADGNGEQDLNGDGVPLWTISQVGMEPGYSSLPERSEDAAKISGKFRGGETVFVIVEAHINGNSGLKLHKVTGTAVVDQNGDRVRVEWPTTTGSAFASSETPVITNGGADLYVDYPGPSLTGYAFDTAIPGLGKYLVTLAAWLFAISTMISWSYYGEQGVVFVFGESKMVSFVYKIIYCVAIVVAAYGFIQTDAQLDSLTALGTGVMLWANIPIMLIFGSQAMKAFRSYFKRMKAGEDQPHEAPPIVDVVEGHDVE